MVSVIIPVFNSEKFLCKCIDSVLIQSHRDIELILINDGSTDNSGIICDEYASKDSRVKVIHKENTGPSDSRNYGIRASRGEFTYFADSDDFIDIDAVRILVGSCIDNASDMSIGDFHKIIGERVESSGNNRTFQSDVLLEREDIMEYARKYLSAPNRFPLLTQSWGRIFRTSIIKDNKILFDPKLRTFEDVQFNFSYLKHANRINFLDKPLYNLLIHTDHLSATMHMTGRPGDLFGYREALVAASEYLTDTYDECIVRKGVGQAYVRYTIIQLIRLCMQIDSNNSKGIHKFVSGLIREQRLRDGLKFYSPSRGESITIPIFLKLKLTKLVILAAQRHAKRRYGKI
jgi:glycosyltransferase involved in cell wall biosynthesis